MNGIYIEKMRAFDLGYLLLRGTSGFSTETKLHSNLVY